MACNVGGVDRILRIVIGIALVGWAVLMDGPSWAWIGALPLATGLFGWCPAYLPMGLKTCSSNEK